MKTLSFGLALPLLLGTGLSVQAQDFVGEASRYSRLQFGGPARTQGIAGANVALGADFGNLTSNPAGLGFYQKSELNFSPGLGMGQADASGTGATQQQTKNSFHIASAGLVLARRRPDDDNSDWRGGGFALGFTRLADYNTSFSYKGTVADNASLFQRLREPRTASGSTDYNSALDDVYNQAYDSNYYSLDGLAYSAFLTNFSPNLQNLSITPGLQRNPTLAVPQRETITRSGSLSQFDLGYGANYRDQLYIGGGIGIVSTNNRVTRSYEEDSNTADTSAFKSLNLREEERTTGTGINLRLGVIYRMNDFLRVGASIQTPTYIGLSNTFNQTLDTYFTSTLAVSDYVNQEQGQPAPISQTTGATVSAIPAAYDYAIVTPFRANGGVALTIGKVAFLTGDIEYVGYGQARYHSTPEQTNGDNFSFAEENTDIKNAYQNAINLRFGGELRLAVFRLRAGYAQYGDPYRNGSIDRSQKFYTAGVGLRQNSFFLDVAGVYTTFDQLYSPYTLSNLQEPVITVNNSRFTTNVTAGFTF